MQRPLRESSQPSGVMQIKSCAGTVAFRLPLFFFQAEDGIRDLTVTGVQTCALPIFASIWTAAGSTGPLYKWVRINAATKQSLKANVDNTGLAAANAATPLYYDSGLIPASIVVPPAVGNVPGPVLPPTQKQIYEITALAVLPTGSQSLRQ